MSEVRIPTAYGDLVAYVAEPSGEGLSPGGGGDP